MRNIQRRLLPCETPYHSDSPAIRRCGFGGLPLRQNGEVRDDIDVPAVLWVRNDNIAAPVPKWHMQVRSGIMTSQYNKTLYIIEDLSKF